MRVCKYNEDFTHPDRGVYFHLYKVDFPAMHTHDYWEFFIILSGETKHVTNTGTQLLTTGMGCLVHPWDKHKFSTVTNDYMQLNVMATDEHLRALLTVIDATLYDTLAAITHPVNYELQADTINDIMTTIHLLQTTEDGDRKKYTALLNLVWMDLIKVICRNDLHANYDYPEWLNAFIRKIREPENISRPIAELCSLTYFSYSHLTRLFKHYTGKTLNEYLTNLRLNYAAMLLRTTDMNVLDISSRAGYDSLSHFIRIFKNRFEITPKEYRTSFVPPSVK